MQKRTIKIKFRNGLVFYNSAEELLSCVSDKYEFIDSDDPEFIIFGPWGDDIPEKSDRYTRIGYFCENVYPDMNICEWAFGMPAENLVNNPRYRRIQWHDLDPQKLVKPPEYNAAEIAAQKKHFCNFIYTHEVPYREEFFRQLSRYKKVDAPGKSMNNMNSIDDIYQGNMWERKRQFLSDYKFTISFENYSFPGYQTEKLFDAMLTNSIPIYCGDPLVRNIFNTESFINAADYIEISNPLINWLQKHSQPDFVDIRPRQFNNPMHRIKRKLKTIGREAKMNMQYKKMDFKQLIERIIELDEDNDKYIKMLSQPWFSNNQPPLSASPANRWAEIFG